MRLALRAVGKPIYCGQVVIVFLPCCNTEQVDVLQLTSMLVVNHFNTLSHHLYIKYKIIFILSLHAVYNSECL